MTFDRDKYKALINPDNGPVFAELYSLLADKKRSDSEWHKTALVAHILFLDLLLSDEIPLMRQEELAGFGLMLERFASEVVADNTDERISIFLMSLEWYILRIDFAEWYLRRLRNLLKAQSVRAFLAPIKTGDHVKAKQRLMILASRDPSWIYDPWPRQIIKNAIDANDRNFFVQLGNKIADKKGKFFPPDLNKKNPNFETLLHLKIRHIESLNKLFRVRKLFGRPAGMKGKELNDYIIKRGMQTSDAKLSPKELKKLMIRYGFPQSDLA